MLGSPAARDRFLLTPTTTPQTARQLQLPTGPEAAGAAGAAEGSGSAEATGTSDAAAGGGSAPGTPRTPCLRSDGPGLLLSQGEEATQGAAGAGDTQGSGEGGLRNSSGAESPATAAANGPAEVRLHA